jgi:shikimate kinase
MSAMTFRNIYLSGFMGSGKSTVGKILASKLGRSFLDTDLAIEAQTGRSVAAIFTQDGEAAFRALESKIVFALSARTDLVVSLGGGAILSGTNRDHLKRSGDWIYLQVPLSVIRQRLINSTTRPLLQGAANAIDVLYARRQPLYKLAPIVIDCGSSAPDAVCAKILTQLNRP